MYASCIYLAMSNLDNVFGAIALGLSDQILEAMETETGLSPNEAATLVHVNLRPGKTITSLSTKLRLSHPGTVRVVDRLLSRGLINRLVGKDKRQALLQLTPEGQQILSDITTARARALSLSLAPLTKSDRQALEPILRILVSGTVRDSVDAYAHCRFCDTDRCYANMCPVEAFARDSKFQDIGG